MTSTNDSHFELNERALCHRDGFVFEVTIDEVLVCDESPATQSGTMKRFYLIHYVGWDEGYVVVAHRSSHFENLC